MTVSPDLVERRVVFEDSSSLENQNLAESQKKRPVNFILSWLRERPQNGRFIKGHFIVLCYHIQPFFMATTPFYFELS